MWLRKVSEWAYGTDGVHDTLRSRPGYARQLYLSGTRRILTIQRWAEEDADVQLALKALQANRPEWLSKAGRMGSPERAHLWPSIWGGDG